MISDITNQPSTIVDSQLLAFTTKDLGIAEGQATAVSAITPVHPVHFVYQQQAAGSLGQPKPPSSLCPVQLVKPA